MTPESHLERQVLLALSREETRLFRNSVAVGWVGQFDAGLSARVSAMVGARVTALVNARRNSFGLAIGSGDLIGWTTRDGVAVFTSLELKAPHGTVRPEQIQWDKAVREAGGLSGIVRSVEEARGVLNL